MSQSDDSPLASIREALTHEAAKHLPDGLAVEEVMRVLRRFIENHVAAIEKIFEQETAGWSPIAYEVVLIERIRVAVLAALAAPPDSTPSGAIEVQPGLYVAHQSTSIFQQAGSPSEEPDTDGR